MLARIAHLLMLAREQTDPDLMRRYVDAALLLVRREHHRRNIGS